MSIVSRKESQETQELSNDSKVLKLCDLIRKTSLEVHSYFKHGHLEKNYLVNLVPFCG